MKARSRYRREAAPDGERRTGGRDGTFVAASLAGWFTAFFCVLCVSFTPVAYLATHGHDQAALVLLFCLSCFVGGFLSGWILQADLEPHGCKVLWLAAASPALPIWLITALLAAIGTEIDPLTLLMICLVCAASLAGALVGHWFGHRVRVTRGRKRYSPPSSAPTGPTEGANVTENTARRETG